MRKAQGEFVPKDRLAILDELVLTVLSQHTSDLNRDRAFAQLKETFPTWDEVFAAPVEEVADAIRRGGIADVKARRIQQILREIEQREGSLDLERLNDLSDEQVEEYLCGLPGVGPKTAACVLVFSMGRHAFPIDTHVHRVARRLGWIGERASAEAAHRSLTPRVPPEIRYSLHVAFIEHGRKICKPKMPRCTDCAVFDFCEAGPRLLAAGDAV
ncbi:MAG: endonuclease III [Actinomycetota bacterium]|nr:endonuclease III [Actinomycetota bacterium]